MYITDDALLIRKSNKEVLEDLPTRISKVTSFLSLFRPGLEYYVVPIDDVYGPTGWDPNVQALVVSKETLSGSDASAYMHPNHMVFIDHRFVVSCFSPPAEGLTCASNVYDRRHFGHIIKP